MKIDRYKTIVTIEVEPIDYPGSDPEIMADMIYTGICKMIQNPELTKRATSLMYQDSLIGENLKQASDDLREKWEM